MKLDMMHSLQPELKGLVDDITRITDPVDMAKARAGGEEIKRMLSAQGQKIEEEWNAKAKEVWGGDGHVFSDSAHPSAPETQEPAKVVEKVEETPAGPVKVVEKAEESPVKVVKKAQPERVVVREAPVLNRVVPIKEKDEYDQPTFYRATPTTKVVERVTEVIHPPEE